MNTCLYFFKNYCFICGVTCFAIFSILLSFKITDCNEKLVVFNKSHYLKTPAISVDKKQPRSCSVKQVF